MHPFNSLLFCLFFFWLYFESEGKKAEYCELFPQSSAVNVQTAVTGNILNVQLWGSGGRLIRTKLVKKELIHRAGLLSINASRKRKKRKRKRTPPSRTLIFQPGITNKIPGLYLGLKSRLKMNFAGENIAPPYSGQRQEMRLSHEQYSITKSHHPPLQASPKTVPVSRWHFLEVEENDLQTGEVFQFLFGEVAHIRIGLMQD